MPPGPRLGCGTGVGSGGTFLVHDSLGFIFAVRSARKRSMAARISFSNGIGPDFGGVEGRELGFGLAQLLQGGRGCALARTNGYKAGLRPRPSDRC